MQVSCEVGYFIDVLAKSSHEQIQIKDGSIGNSYEKVFHRFLDGTVTQITVQDPYIRAFHQVSNIDQPITNGSSSPSSL